MNNFEEYGFEADFEGEILSDIEDYYIGYYVESYPRIKEKQKIPTFWNKNNGNCYKGAGVSNSKFSLKPIKKEMNREIKFRAWDERNKIMHNEVEFIRSGTGGDDWILFKSDKQKLEYGNVFNSPYFQQQIKIMQYTGLKDKNGVEIYEGDIVRYIKEFDIDKNINVAIVEYVSDRFRCGFILKPIIETQINFGSDDENCECIVSFSFYDEMGQNFVWDKLEVIGNIYENPELLN